MSAPEIALDDPDRSAAGHLLDEVMFGDHSNDSADAVIAQALKRERRAERRRIVSELRAFADDLYGTTGARWIADALTATLDRLSEDGEA